MRLMILSSVSLPPSLRALVMDLEPCSFVANSRRPSKRWSSVNFRCFSDPCSRTRIHWSTLPEEKYKRNALCWMQYEPHWLLATSLKTAGPWLRSSSTMPSLASASRFSKACCGSHQLVSRSVEVICVTWTTSEPVSWQASDAHFPLSDLLTLAER